jgi:hypothetical protein
MQKPAVVPFGPETETRAGQEHGHTTSDRPTEPFFSRSAASGRVSLVKALWPS